MPLLLRTYPLHNSLVRSTGPRRISVALYRQCVGELPGGAGALSQLFLGGGRRGPVEVSMYIHYL